jgi:type IV pilus assembly protein PilY1
MQMRNHRQPTHFVYLLLGSMLTIALTATASRADDADLFSAKVPPNVLLVVDDSISMFNVIYHPAFDPDSSYACSTPSSTRYVGPSSSSPSWEAGVDQSMCGKTRWLPGLDTDHDGVADDKMKYPSNYLNWIFSDAVDASYDIDGDGSTDGTILGQIQSYQRAFSGCKDTGSYYYFHRDRAQSSRQILREVLCQVNLNGKLRFGFATFRHTEPTGSNPAPNGGFVQIPIGDATVDHDSNPATPEIDNTYTLNGQTKTHLEHLYDTFETFAVDSNTPLAETLYQMYTYFMSRDAGKLPYGDADKDGTPDASAGRFPAYAYTTDPVTNYGGPNIADVGGSAPPCPVNEWCQKNFIVMITDGEPWRDEFAIETGGSSGNTAVGFDDFFDLIGNYKDNVGSSDPQCEATRTHQCWYMDDIAKFMQEHDFLPDDTNPTMTGLQNIDTYTIGFATSNKMNDFLKATAEAGGGKFSASGDPDELKDDIIAALQEIIEKSQVFTAPTVPASRSSDGSNFYLSYFRPAAKTSFWEGHLKLFDLNAAGEIKDVSGDCIFRDPLDPSIVRCDGGTLQLDQNGFWDAANEVPLAGSRALFFSDYATGRPLTVPSSPVAFSEANVGAANLGLADADIPLYSNVGSGTAGLGDAEQLSDAVVRYVRGCEFGSGSCVDRGDGRKLSDIFHSSPLAVGPPNAPITNAGYRLFASKYATRTKVIYAGTNGGFVHGFETGTWRTTATAQVPSPPGYDRGTGGELFGFMPYPARQNARHLPTDLPPRDHYYVDGSPSAADVWLYPSETATPGGSASWSQWHTVLVGGLRQGGEAVYALDITNPDAVPGGPAYPSYLWEFPCEDTTDSVCTGGGTYAWAEYMGETWSRPVITRVRMAASCSPPSACPEWVERWVAIFGAGYHESGDPNDVSGSYDDTLSGTTARKGRAVFMVDVTSGKVLATKRFDTDSSQGDPAMRYAFASAPAVFDLDYDGFADVVYFPDLGGQLWKWVIRAPAEDTLGVSASGDVQQPGWTWKRLFAAEDCPVGTCATRRTKSFYSPPTGTRIHGQLHLAFGSGERAQLEYIGSEPEERNRYYVLKDIDPLDRNTPASDPDPRYTDALSGGVVDVASLSGSCTPPTSPDVGFYFEGADGEKFITESTIFAGSVLMGSFVPSSSTDTCDAAGSGYLHYFDLFCGAGKWDDPASMDPADKVVKVYVGQGPPTRPTISVGDLSEQSSTSTNCNNKVYAFSSDGQGIVDATDCMPSSGVRLRTWQDLD